MRALVMVSFLQVHPEALHVPIKGAWSSWRSGAAPLMMWASRASPTCVAAPTLSVSCNGQMRRRRICPEEKLVILGKTFKEKKAN